VDTKHRAGPVCRDSADERTIPFMSKHTHLGSARVRESLARQATKLIAKKKKWEKKSSSVWTVSGGLPDTSRSKH